MTRLHIAYETKHGLASPSGRCGSTGSRASASTLGCVCCRWCWMRRPSAGGCNARAASRTNLPDVRRAAAPNPFVFAWFSGVGVGRSQESPRWGESRPTLPGRRPRPALSTPSPRGGFVLALPALPSPRGLPEMGTRPVRRGAGRGAGGSDGGTSGRSRGRRRCRGGGAGGRGRGLGWQPGEEPGRATGLLSEPF
jgi:hypothetical protein